MPSKRQAKKDRETKRAETSLAKDEREATQLYQEIRNSNQIQRSTDITARPPMQRAPPTATPPQSYLAGPGPR